MKTIIRTIATIATFAFATPAIAGGVTVAEDGDSKLKLSSKFFLNSTYNKTTANGVDTAKSTGLAVDRAYLTAQYQIDKVWSMKLTTDALLNSAKVGGKKTEVFIKNAFIQAKFAPELQLNLGVIGTPWVGYEDKLGKHRYVSKSYVDTKKLDSSADAGAGISGKVVDGLFGYAVAVVNGKGYGDITATRGVDFNSRIGFYPVKGLTIDLGYRTGYLGTKSGIAGAGNKSTLTQALVTYGMGKDFRIGTNFINNKKDAAGTVTKTRAIETWAWANFGNGFGAFGRFENSRIKETAQAINIKENRYVAGLEYFANKNITISLAGDFSKTSDTGHIAGITTKKIRAGLYTQAKF